MVASKLSAALARFAERVHEPRAYGVNDCCIAVADVLEAAHGHDLMALYGRRYRSQRGFLRIIRKHGCRMVRDAVEHAAIEAGWRELALHAPEDDDGGFVAEMPQDFDLGLVYGGSDDAVHVVPAFFHGGVWRGLTQDGAVFAVEAIKGWRFG